MGKVQTFLGLRKTQFLCYTSPLMVYTAKLVIRDIVTAKPNQLIYEVANAMKERNTGSVIVAEQGNKPVGIFTERDLCRKVVANGLDVLKIRASEVMTKNIISINAADPIERAFEALAAGRFRHVPVIEKQEVVGMVSLSDLAKLLCTKLEIFTTKNNAKMSYTARLLLRDVVTVDPYEFVFKAANIMKERNTGSVIVAQEGTKPLGIFTERDLCRNVVAGGLAPLSTKISAVMNKTIVSIDVSDPLEKAFEILAAGQCRHVPIMEGEEVAGMVSLTDMVKLLHTKWSANSSS
ncbi:MAG: CBS domain-containing protein [Elusimicrobia bacterium]|nr:CBS domain-containing protein [Elusimicrobiota bacterium]